MRVGTGADALIGGVILRGAGSKAVIVRGIGPSLQQLGLAGALPDPVLEIYDSSQNIIDTNDDWRSDPDQRFIESSGFAPADERESALVTSFQASSYTARLYGKDDTTGIGLVELYDLAGGSSPELVNISTRGLVQPEPNVLIAGFIIQGNTSAQLVVRAIGPSIRSASLPNTLDDPVLQLFDKDGTQIDANDDWRDTQETAIRDTGLAPRDDKESALLISQPPGIYTAIVRGVADTSGVAVVEIYKLAP